MAEVNSNFSPSINIERDRDKEFEYVVTPNSRQIYNQLINSLDSGIHSFTIIGSYGTGKSSFLVALRKNLNADTVYFEPLNGEFSGVDDFQFDFIVGQYSSIIDAINDHFAIDCSSEKEVLEWIKEKHQKLKSEGKFWFLVIDEFGKHLEYAAKENPERELYFIQLISEFANEKDKNFYLITTLHQAFDSYAHGLDQQQRKEWDKVRGRLKELTFNEPVEQLIYIASEYLSDSLTKASDAEFNELVKAIESAQAFPLKNDLNKKLAHQLYPLDPLSAAVLSLSLQKYGQNERSLFTFLQSDELYGINNYQSDSNPFYNLSCVYDYLIHNHHSYLSSKYNSHYIHWNALKKAIQRVESNFNEEVFDLKKLVKTIGLLNIFATDGAKLDKDFLLAYGEVALGVKNIQEYLTKLEDEQIIRYRSFKGQYILFEGTDFDIDFELENASSQIDPINEVVTSLKKYFDFPYLPAKRVYYEKGTPRFFEFKLSEKPLKKSPQQPIDGLVNLVFEISKEEVSAESKQHDSPILYGIFNNTEDIRTQLFDIEKTKHVLKKVGSDQVAERELNTLLDSQISELNNLILDNIYSGKGAVEWIFNGKSLDINDSRSLNNELSNICEVTYNKTPIFHNELVNKHKVSPAIYRPRKTLLKALINKKDKKNLGFEEDKFPAEKTIYLSLLQDTGIHQKEDNNWFLGEPNDESGLNELWEISEEFFNSTTSGKRPLTDFISILKEPPLGLKDGFIELWLPIFMIIKDGNYALFQEEAYIPELSYDIANLIYRNPKLFEIKAYHISDVKRKVFSKYREYQNQDGTTEFSNESFVETIRPFLLIYNDLNEYGRKTTKISQNAQRLRDAIKTATEPEKAFFEEFPRALGYTNLDVLEDDEAIRQFVYDLDKCIDEIKNAYNQLVDRVEQCLLSSLNINTNTEFDDYKRIIQGRYESLKTYKLLPYQKKLYGRLMSNLSNREKWISSIAFAILDKPLYKISDDEEPLLLDRINSRLGELDNLRDLSDLEIDSEKQEVFKLKLQTFEKEPLDLNVIIEKSKLDQESKRFQKLKESLTDDNDVNLALLLKMIEDIKNHE